MNPIIFCSKCGDTKDLKEYPDEILTLLNTQPCPKGGNKVYRSKAPDNVYRSKTVHRSKYHIYRKIAWMYEKPTDEYKPFPTS